MDSVLFRDRRDAGRQLASRLSGYAQQHAPIVLALPRGGVPVAFEIAQHLHCPLDVFIVRKLGVPQHAELAFGAIDSSNQTVLNSSVIQQFRLNDADMQTVIHHEQRELARREVQYRGDRPFPTLDKRTVILVDDGIATGASIKVAIHALRKHTPYQLVVAVPVAPLDTLQALSPLVDACVCLQAEEDFYSVGAYYQHFDQTTDEEVCQLLNQASAY